MLRRLVFLLCVLGLAWVASAARSDASPPAAGSLAPTGHTLPLVRPLPFFHDLYTFRGDGGATTVVAAFAVPAGKLGEEKEEWAVRYRFDVSLILSDTMTQTVSRTDDSVFVRLPKSVEAEHLLHTHIEVAAPPSPHTVQRVIMTDAATPGRGQLYSSPFPIPDYGGDELMLSDIALGLPGAEVGWERGDAVLALLPTSQFPESAFDVYYEIYNLPAGTPYTTDISIERIDEAGAPVAGEGGPVNLRFTGESPAGPDAEARELRRVESSLDEGRYRLTVDVTDQMSGESARTARIFEVRGWGPGATMVPALSRTWPPIRTGGG